MGDKYFTMTMYMTNQIIDISILLKCILKTSSSQFD